MYFSDLCKKLFYWECDLCGVPVIMTDQEQRGQSCICISCMKNELKVESELMEVAKNG